MFGSDRLLIAWCWARAWLADEGRALAASRQRGWGLVEFAIGVLVLVLGASVGLKILSGDLSQFFSDLGNTLRLPAGGIGSGSAPAP
jgi:hypothetical protein